MKPTFIFPIVTAVLGFSAAWLLKPAPEIPSPNTVEKSEIRKKPAATPAESATEPETEVVQDLRTPSPLAPSKLPGFLPTDEERAKVTQSKDAAKMSRLTEALGLSQEQQEKLSKAFAEAIAPLAPAGGSFTPAEQYAATLAAAENLQKALNALLTPDQLKEFAALRKRSEENAIEINAQSSLANVAGQIDLSPEQRTQALERLRDSAVTQLAGRPAALSLALDNSVLPVGGSAVSEKSIETLTQLVNASENGAGETRNSFTENHLKRLDEQLILYKGILTPAQEAQLKADIEERKATVGRVGELIR
jgi:hypothetical protein